MDKDDIICTCMGTTVGDIMDAVENGAASVEEIGTVTQAGTVCGACLGEIEALLQKLKKK